MTAISVIVPVYNVENYLVKCLDSIINQTLTDIEIICVNDGSTDTSRQILETYKRKDSRIKIIDKQNGGLSSARNAGFKHATGEYISYIDSDDWVDITMLEKLYKNIKKHDGEIAICAVHQYDDTKKELCEPQSYFSLETFDKTFDDKTFTYMDTKEFLNDVCVMAWNKLYKKSFLDKCEATFPEGLIFEDGPFFFSIFFKAKKVSIIRDFLYYYRINRQGSIVQSSGEKYINIIDIVNLMTKEVSKTPIFEEVRNEFYRSKANDILYRYDLTPIKLKRKFSKKFKKESILLDETLFDYSQIIKEMPIVYRRICELGNKAGLIQLFWWKIVRRIKYKTMEIMYKEPGVYYFKFWKHIYRLKKRDDIYNFWYENERVYIQFMGRYRFSFKFEYAALEENDLR